MKGRLTSHIRQLVGASLYNASYWVPQVTQIAKSSLSNFIVEVGVVVVRQRLVGGHMMYLATAELSRLLRLALHGLTM